MKNEPPPKANYHLEPGYIYGSSDGAVIRTVVGSCVAVTLWDHRLNAGGMNHYIHPRIRKDDRRTTQFGNVALPALLRVMKKEFGSAPADLYAQIIGGASPLQLTHKTAASDNVSIARQFLTKYNLKIVSEDVGGFLGRKILFDTHNGRVVILKVEQLRRDDWVRQLQ